MLRSLIASSALLALVGCGSGEVKLGVDVAAMKSIVSTGTTTTPVDGTGETTAGEGLELTRVRLLVAHAKIGYIGEQSTGASAEAGPYVIDLTADEIANGAHREFSLGTLPTGTYGGAEIEIEPLEADQDASDTAFDDFRTSGASVIVDGTYQGKVFTFAGHFLAEQGTDGEVTIDAASPVTLAMTVDTSSWFQDESGTLVDPADTTQHDALAVAICETLDTQPATDGAPGATAQHAGGKGGKGGKGGGGGHEHCVEAAP